MDPSSSEHEQQQNSVAESSNSSSSAEVNKSSSPVDRSTNSNKCAVCGKIFKNPEMLGYHKKVHDNCPPFRCTVCNQSLEGKEELKTHAKGPCASANPGSAKVFQCAFCSWAHLKPHKLLEHFDVHLNSYHCETCDLVATRKSDLTQHQKTLRHKQLLKSIGNQKDEGPPTKTPEQQEPIFILEEDSCLWCQSGFESTPKLMGHLMECLAFEKLLLGQDDKMTTEENGLPIADLQATSEEMQV